MHIHLIIHIARLILHHAKTAGNVRFLGTMLLLLLFSCFEVAGAARTVVPGTTEGERGRESSLRDTGRDDEAPAVSKWRITENRIDLAHGESPAALRKNAHRSVVSRLSPGIVLIPRMNRTPKPKSVYRLYARAPGKHLLQCPNVRSA
jgi:hypothetical protein